MKLNDKINLKMKSVKRQYKLSELIKGLDVTIKGDPDCAISGIATIQRSEPGHITFLINSHYKKYLPETRASAVILDEENVSDCRVNAIISSNPYFVYAKIAAFFADQPQQESAIHHSCVIGKDTFIHPTAKVGPSCVIGDNVKIGMNVVIGPCCTVGDKTHIGDETIIDANVSIYHAIIIGKRVRIASGVVIGSDGFGFANQKNTWHKVPQLGSVIIGNDVDIGANTTIDRGAVEDTIIEDGVKLDNLIQVGHNVVIGSNTIIAGCVAIAGTTLIGKNCMIGGATCFAGHLSICDNTMITGMTAVTKSIQTPGIYSSGIVGAVPNHEFRKNNARFHRLGNLTERVKALEQALKNE